MSDNKFLTQLESNPAATPVMTLAHTTNVGKLYEILKGDLVKATHNFNGTPTLYFYYGVNFYKYKPECNDNLSRVVGFLFKNDALNSANSVFPFDTGAYIAHLYGDYLKGDVMEYEVPIANKETPAKLVTLLYETNEDYLFGRPKKLKTAKTPREIRLIEFIKDATNKIYPSNKFDARCHAIEVQFIEAQHFRDNVELVILPRQSYEEDLKGLFGSELTGLKVDYYDDMPLSGPTEDSVLIRQKAIDYLREKGML